MVTHYSRLLHATWLGWAIAGGVPWIWPLFAALHFVGMALLVGSVGMLDLRMLGVGKGLPIRALAPLLPWGMLGFVINLLTGIGFYAGNPDQYQTVAFAAKLTCIVIAGAHVIWFYKAGLARRVDAVGAGQDAPLAAKLSAVASLTLWLGVIFWGRMLTFFSDAF